MSFSSAENTIYGDIQLSARNVLKIHRLWDTRYSIYNDIIYNIDSAVVKTVVVESSRCSSKTYQKGSCLYAPLDEALRYVEYDGCYDYDNLHNNITELQSWTLWRVLFLFLNGAYDGIDHWTLLVTWPLEVPYNHITYWSFMGWPNYM